MSVFWRGMLAVYSKDIRLEMRTKDVLVSSPVFALLVMVIFSFTLDPSPQIVNFVAPGILWVAFVFAGMLGLSRNFVLEKDRSTLDGLLLAPVGRDAVFAGKLLGAFTIMLAGEVFVLPIFAGLYNVAILQPLVLVVMVLATLGFAAVGTTFSAIAVNTRAREVLLPILFLPVVLPVIIAAVVSTSLILEGAGWSDIHPWFALMVAFDAIVLVVSSWLSEFVLEE